MAGYSYGDDKPRAVKSAVDHVKGTTRLQGDNQSPAFSGHESAPYGGGPPQNAAVPGGAPGTGGVSNQGKGSSMSKPSHTH